MRKIENLNISYVGYAEPNSVEEVELEMLGLETVVAVARKRMAVLKQSLKLQEIMKNSMVDDNEETIEKADNLQEAK
jgi:hypothetical protein